MSFYKGIFLAWRIPNLTLKAKQITKGEKVYTVKVLQKLNEDPNEGSRCLRGLKFCMEYFFTKPHLW